MRPRTTAGLKVVTQLMGGHDDPQVQISATRLLDRFSRLTGAQAIFLPAPGMVRDAEVRKAILHDPAVTDVLRTWRELTVAIVGVGSIAPSPMLERSGNALHPEQRDRMREAGAVGDVCLRFFDTNGKIVESGLDGGVVGISPQQLLTVPRRIGLAGGADKHVALRAAIVGGWVNTLITDIESARKLLNEPV